MILFFPPPQQTNLPEPYPTTSQQVVAIPKGPQSPEEKELGINSVASRKKNV
jgi:hypothetical protein